MFWPESEESRARQALRQAIYVLRNELGEGILVNRGEEEIGLNWDAVWCDAAAFDEAVRGGDYERALELYQGNLLPGFHLSDAPEFARFLDNERANYRREAAAAAWALAVKAGDNEDAVSAVRWARSAVAIEPLEEERLRTVISQLDKLGDRTAAIGLFEDFARRLANEYELEPAPETVDLVTIVRARSVAVRPQPASADRPETHVTPTSGVETAKEIRRPSRWAVAIVAIAVSVGVSWLAFGSLLRETGSRANAAPRIAVLPLDNVGAEEDEWFADGMTDEITSRLANLGGLVVIARQSTVQYKGSTKSAGQIAEELNVDYLLEGTVQAVHAEDGLSEVRIRPQLVRADDEAHVWAQSYTVPFAAISVLQMQGEVADRVVQALSVTVGDSERGRLDVVPTNNTEAYEFYLRGREYVAGAVPDEDLRVAVQMYERAVELDPRFAVAYAALAEAHLHLWWRFYDRTPERIVRAKAAIDSAFAQDSLLPEAQTALGFYYFWGLLDFDRALETFEAGRSSRPHDANHLYGIGSVLRRQGRLDEALGNLYAAADINPRSALVARDIANTHAFLRNRNEAERYFHHAIELDPGWPTYVRDVMHVHLRLDGSLTDAGINLAEARELGFEHPALTLLEIWVEISSGNYQRALDLLDGMPVDVVETNSFFYPRPQLYAEVYDLMGDVELRRVYYDSSRSLSEARLRVTPNDPRVRSALGIAHAGLGGRDDAIRAGERAVELRPVERDAWHGVYRLESLAVIHSMLGQQEEAIELLEYLLSIPGTLTSAFLRIDYRFNALRNHPRYQALLARNE
jgi:TolB-like protein/DNA-binding SARP family transcriptional activator/Tfp pilus assembly protein PilF